MSNGQLIELENVSPEPDKSFSVDPAALVQHEDDAVATWHTHPTGPAGLSGQDYLGFLQWPDLLHVIVSPEGCLGYIIRKGAVLNDAGQDHPAWGLEGDVAL